MTAQACAYCDKPFRKVGQPHYGHAMTRDHIVPRSFAVPGTAAAGRGNVVEVCGMCNGLKGQMFPAGMRAVADEHRKRAALLERIADRVDALIIERRLMS